ncbi:MAG: rRNA maturation RNase YbeY [candidate division NC10 bacterium]|nr:rRNA maturation RNase YbeY [candidate division NC10 bacterium]
MGEKALSALARPTAECSVLLVDDAAMAALNHAYRGVTGPTDVLAFSMTEGRFGATWPSSRACDESFDRLTIPTSVEGLRRGAQAEGPDLLGDVVISAETARRQARVRKRGLRAELALLLVHGILHLLGHDHGTPGERRRMWQKQQVILAACGIRAPAMGPPNHRARAGRVRKD